MRNSSCHSPTVLQFAIILTRKRYDLYTPLLTVLLPVGYLWTRHQIVSFFSPSILYKATLIAEIFLVSGGISLNPVPISLCMFGFLTASKGCCSEVNNTEPRQKKKTKKKEAFRSLWKEQSCFGINVTKYHTVLRRGPFSPELLCTELTPSLENRSKYFSEVRRQQHSHTRCWFHHGWGMWQGAVHFCSVEVPSRDLWAASVSKGHSNQEGSFGLHRSASEWLGYGTFKH